MDIELYLKRRYGGAAYTIGSLYAGNDYFCDTLEDTLRPLPAVCPTRPRARLPLQGESLRPNRDPAGHLHDHDGIQPAF